MTISPVTYSVFAAPGLSTYNLNTTHTNNESVSSGAVAIGNLQQQGTSITVSDQGTTDGVQTYNFTLQQGDNAYLGLSFGNVVDQASTHIQLYDSGGNLIADNEGTTAQKAVFTQLTSSGYAPGAGNYSLQVTPPPDSEAPDVAISALQQQGTALSVNSQLTSDDPAEYYSFSLYNSQNLKLAFNSQANSSATRIQLYDSTGNLIADNRGNQSQKDAFASLTSGIGLTRSAGDYIVKVSYSDNSSAAGQDLKYNFQLYSGSSYAVLYQTNVTAATGGNTADASVTAAANAQVFGQQAYHAINETAQSGVAVGYLNQNKTALDVTSLLTPVDANDYYSFVLQGTSNNIKLSLSNLTNKNDTGAVRLQLLNAGGQVIADNQGTTAQQTAFQQLTSGTGVTGKAGTYYVKATYGAGAAKTDNLTYNFKLYSGTSYSAVYRTSASAQTYENALLSGTLGGNYSTLSASAAYIASGFTTGVFGTTNSFA